MLRLKATPVLPVPVLVQNFIIHLSLKEMIWLAFNNVAEQVFCSCHFRLHFINLVQVGNTKFCTSPIIQRQELTLPVTSQTAGGTGKGKGKRRKEEGKGKRKGRGKGGGGKGEKEKQGERGREREKEKERIYVYVHLELGQIYLDF